MGPEETKLEALPVFPRCETAAPAAQSGGWLAGAEASMGDWRPLASSAAP